MLYGRLVHMCKTLIDLQILSCELHQTAFSSRAPCVHMLDLYIVCTGNSDTELASSNNK